MIPTSSYAPALLSVVDYDINGSGSWCNVETNSSMPRLFEHVSVRASSTRCVPLVPSSQLTHGCQFVPDAPPSDSDLILHRILLLLKSNSNPQATTDKRSAKRPHNPRFIVDDALARHTSREIAEFKT